MIQNYKTTERRKDRSTERHKKKDRKTERRKDRKTERQKDRKTERQKDRKTERQRGIIEIDKKIVYSYFILEQKRTLEKEKSD